MTADEILKKIEAELASLEYETTYEEGSEDTQPFVGIHLGMDDNQGDLMLIVTASEQFPTEEDESNEESPPHYIVSFSVPYQYEIEENNISDLLWTVNMLNSTIDMPGFFLNFEELKMYYTYTWITPEEFKTATLDMICANVLLASISFSKVLESVAKGESTYEQVLDAMNVFTNISEDELENMLGSLDTEDEEFKIDGKEIEAKVKKIKKKEE